mgnify:CR=1 FL=1
MPRNCKMVLRTAASTRPAVVRPATPWITKQANLRLLTDFARSGKSPALHIATHLSNLIKVSDRVTVRHSAGIVAGDFCDLMLFVQSLRRFNDGWSGLISRLLPCVVV